VSAELRDAARAIKPVPLQEYLRSRGWRLDKDLSEESGVVLYAHDGLVVDVPQRTEFADYARRVAEVLSLVADVEQRSPLALVEELIQPAGDVLGVRVDSEIARSGTLPLLDSIRVREGTKNLILASAHSAITPQAYFPRMSRGDAATLLASVREGQNQRGSFVARFIVPVEPAVGEQVPMDDESFDPFGRQVVKLLMRALDGVHRVRSLGAYDDLLSMEGQGVSGNLLAALAAMRTAIGAGSLELSMSWARNRKPPENVPSRVEFPAEALHGLDAVAEKMRGRAQTKGFELEGYVTTLKRPAAEVDTAGDVDIVPSGDDARELSKVSVHLASEPYKEAIAAHRNGELVRVVGTLSKKGRRWILTDASGFERAPAGPDESGPAVGQGQRN
jgi:hypothetical protein